VAPAWAAEPVLLDALFEHVNKNRSGAITLSEWASLVEALGSLKGKLRVLYGMCGDKGDPVRTATIIGLLCSCWRNDGDVTEKDLSAIRDNGTPYTPEKFVRLLRKHFPELVTSLELLSFHTEEKPLDSPNVSPRDPDDVGVIANEFLKL
jgi:hypothetical protein